MFSSPEGVNMLIDAFVSGRGRSMHIVTRPSESLLASDESGALSMQSRLWISTCRVAVQVFLAAP